MYTGEHAALGTSVERMQCNFVVQCLAYVRQKQYWPIWLYAYSSRLPLMKPSPQLQYVV